MREVVLFVDTFNRYFEPENARAALKVLQAAGYSVHMRRAALCCGRTFLSAGLVDEAKREARRMLDALAPVRRARHADRRARALVPVLAARRARRAAAGRGNAGAAARCCSRNSCARATPGRLEAAAEAAASEALLHGHCHQKAFDAMPAVEKVLRLIPGLKRRRSSRAAAAWRAASATRPSTTTCR